MEELRTNITFALSAVSNAVVANAIKEEIGAPAQPTRDSLKAGDYPMGEDHYHVESEPELITFDIRFANGGISRIEHALKEQKLPFDAFSESDGGDHRSEVRYFRPGDEIEQWCGDANKDAEVMVPLSDLIYIVSGNDEQTIGRSLRNYIDKNNFTGKKLSDVIS